MSKVAEKQKVAVIGGGLAGLSAALNIARLARDEVSVTVFERSPNPGGRAQTTHKDGFSLNFGPHALYLGGAAFPFLKELGIDPAGATPPTTRATAFYKGKSMLLPLTFADILQTTLLGFMDKLRLLAFMSRLNSFDESSVESLTVNEWIDSDKGLRNGGKALKSLVATLVQLTTYTGDMSKLSAAAGVRQLKLAVSGGVSYLHGGWAQMINALVEKSQQAGVEIVGGYEVNEIFRSVETGKITVVFKNAQQSALSQTFDGIILAVPPNAVNSILGKTHASQKVKVLELGDERLEDVRAACLDICLSQLPYPEKTFALGVDEPVYYSVHSSAARLAPANGALIHLAYYLKGDETGDHQIEKRLEKVMDDLQPGWREKLVYKRYLANIAVTHKLLTVKDAKLGGYWTEKTNEPDVFRAGDWVGTHPLADGSLGSAKVSSELLIAHLQKQSNCQESSFRSLAACSN